MNITSNNKGMTLAEVLISLLLLAIVLTGGMGFYFNADEAIALVTHKKFATEIANLTLEDLKRGGYPNLPPSGPGISTALTDTDDPLHIIKNLSATKTVTVTDIDDPVGGTNPVDYKKVEVIVTWSEAGKNTARKTNLVTYMAP